MKRYSLIIDRINKDIMERSCKFLDEASQISGVIIDRTTFSVIFEELNEKQILALAKKYGIVDFTK